PALGRPRRRRHLALGARRQLLGHLPLLRAEEPLAGPADQADRHRRADHRLHGRAESGGEPAARAVIDRSPAPRIRDVATTEDPRASLDGTAEWKREPYDAAPEREGELFSTISGLENEPLYTPETVEIDYDRDLGSPGVYPFTRGVYPSIYRGKLCTLSQLAGCDAARVLRVRRRAAGRAAGGAPRDDPDGHPQGVHRPEGVDLPARAVDAARRRHDRALRARVAALAPDLDLRLPHPRGGLDGGAGARLHARRRLRVRRRGARARPRRRRLRAAPQ